MTDQLRIDGVDDGRLVPAKPRQAPLNISQKEIIRLLMQNGSIRPLDAGVIVHKHRLPPCHRCELGICPWASSDGSEALKRLEKRGLVHKQKRGVWKAA